MSSTGASQTSPPPPQPASSGKRSVPTDPLGATPPTQFAEFDQKGDGEVPLQVKSVAQDDDGTPNRTPRSTATMPRRIFRVGRSISGRDSRTVSRAKTRDAPRSRF